MTPSSRRGFDFEPAPAPTPQLLRIPASASTSHASNTAKPQRFIPIAEWLPTLNNRRDEDDDINYLSLQEALLDEDVRSTRTVISLGIAGLTGIGGMKRGTAARLVAWAIDDRDA